MGLDTRIAALCAKVQGNEQSPYPTFPLCLCFLLILTGNPCHPVSLAALAAVGDRSRGIQPLTGAALTADERIVIFLKGINYLDDRLTALVEPMAGSSWITAAPSQQEDVASIVKGLQAASEKTPVIELLGHDTASKELIAGQAAAALGLNLYAIDLKTLPAELVSLKPSPAFGSGNICSFLWPCISASTGPLKLSKAGFGVFWNAATGCYLWIWTCHGQAAQ